MRIQAQLANENPQAFGSRLRRLRAEPLFEMIRTVARAKGSCTIIDIGGEESYWSAIAALDLLRETNSRVLLVNKDENVLHVENNTIFDTRIADACALGFPNQSFDIAHSNSVVEHLVSWEGMMKFAEETRRIGRGYFVQTPNFWFPIEPHFILPFFHFLPEPMRVALVMRRPLGWFPKASDANSAVSMVQSCRLLDITMFRALFPDATITTERFLGFTKSLIAIRAPAPPAEQQSDMGSGGIT